MAKRGRKKLVKTPVEEEVLVGAIEEEPKKRAPKKTIHKPKDLGIRTQELLPRKLSKIEMEAYSRSVTELHQEILWEKNELASIMKDRKAKISKLEKNFNETLDVMRDGKVYEPISCFKKVIDNSVVFFSDEGEEITSRPATDTDRQVEMFHDQGMNSEV